MSLNFICVEKIPVDIKERGFRKFMHQACLSFKNSNVDTLKEQFDNFYSSIIIVYLTI